MKKTISILLILATTTANAGLSDWFYFEPTALCLAGAGAGYSSSTVDKNRGQNAAIGCAVGALIGYGINSYYDGKFGNQYQKDLRDKDRMIQDMQWSMATKVEKGLDEDTDGVMIVEQIVPAQEMPNGEVIMPTKRKKLVIPGEGAKFGK